MSQFVTFSRGDGPCTNDAGPSSCHLRGRRDALDSVSSVTTPTRGDKSGRTGRGNTHHPLIACLPVPADFITRPSDRKVPFALGKVEKTFVAHSSVRSR